MDAAHLDRRQRRTCCPPTPRRTPSSRSPARTASARSRSSARAGPALRRRRRRRSTGRGCGRGVRLGAARHRSSPGGHDHSFAQVRPGGPHRPTSSTDADGAHVVSGLNGPGAAQLDRLGVPGLRGRRATPRCPRPTTGSWHLGHRPVAHADAAVRDGVDWAASYDAVRSAARCSASPTYSRSPAADALRDGRGRCSRRSRRSARSSWSLPNRHHFLVDLPRSGWTTRARSST